MIFRRRRLGTGRLGTVLSGNRYSASGSEINEKYRRRTFNMHCIDDNDAFLNRSWIDENNALMRLKLD